jgi:threonine synthase
VGAGPLLGGTQQGFAELYEAGIIDSQPRMLCVQAEGCHPIVEAFEANEPVKPWRDPITTTVGAIADPLVGYVEDGEETRRAVVDSDGGAVALGDEQVYAWTDRLAETEGIYAEPASAASVAAIDSAYVEEDDTVVAMITGHGLKEPAETTPTTTSLDGDPAALRSAVLGD